MSADGETGLAPDPQARAADPDISAFVTANAGAGKTYTLVSRVARLLLAGVHPSKILCLTFTKAAAAEMQRRLFERLGKWSVAVDHELRLELARLEGKPTNAFDQAYVSKARSLFARALETPGGLKIQTIHGFCERLLRRFPLEARVAPTFRVIDDAAAASLAAEARDVVAKAAMAAEDEHLSEAYARFSVALHYRAFEQMFATFEAQRSAIERFFVSPEGGGFVARILDACGLRQLGDAEEIERLAVGEDLDGRAWMAAAEALERGGTSDRNNAVGARLIAQGALRDEPNVEAARRFVYTEDGKKLRARVATSKVEPGMAEFLAREQQRLDRAFETARASRIARDTILALYLAHTYAEAYEAAKQRRAVLDFGDLVEKARELLAERPDAAWVLFKLDGGVDHILVDEAQDTAPEQWDIIRALTGEFFAGLGKAERVMPPTIFVVGDVKQSIFSFQGAKPELLAGEQAHYDHEVTQSGQVFEQVELTVSRRSVQEVLSFVDVTFEGPEMVQAVGGPSQRGGLMLAPSANDNPVLKHLAHRIGHSGCVDLWPIFQDKPGAEQRAWDEPLDAGQGRGAFRELAEAIAREIVALVERGDLVHDKEHPDPDAWRPATYGDVLILVRKRGTLFKELIRALKRSGAPVAGADRLALGEAAVFEDILAVVRFLLYPTDDLTLAGILRSPFCDVGEQALFDLANGRGSGDLWRELQKRRSERREYATAVELLESLRAEAARKTPFDLLARLCERQDRDGRSMRTRLRTRLGPEADDALDETLAQVLALERQGVRDLEGVAHALAQLAVTVKREMDEARGEVRVMTAHGAKGLEAPIVFVPETVSYEQTREPLLELEGGGFLWCIRSASDCDASRRARDLRKQREEHEGFRLLYVALTRARDRVVLAGRLDAIRKEENLKGWWRAVCDGFDRLGGEVRPVESAGVHFRRFGPDPEAAAQRALADIEAAAPEPAWLRTLVPFQPAPKIASPSQALDEAPDMGNAISPIARTSGLGRFRRGEIIHRLLQLLPDIPPDERRAACTALLTQEPLLSTEQREEMTAAAFGVLDDPVFAPVFGPGSRAEASLAGASARLPPSLQISGRVDRLVVAEDRVLVVDYKTNRPAPQAIEDADPAYVAQMAIYVAVLSEIFPGRRVEAALVWTDGPKLMPVPENLVAQSLAALGPAR